MPDFDPSKYLTKVGTADYLEVKWRLVWLREKHPDASIDTDLMSPTDTGEAIFKARIVIPGGGSATGWGSETQDDFRDYLEKAETKALGRALAALGFGTQFSPDHDFGGSVGKVVDTPVDRSRTRQSQPPPKAELVTPAPLNADAARMQRLHGVASEKHGLAHEDLHLIAVGRGKASLKDLTPQELDALTNWLAEKAEPPAIQKAIDAGRDAEILAKK